MACIKQFNNACTELQTNGESEMEEGEIVDDACELSDISSEEEFLLRQRLQVLENYNNVLERKQAKKTSSGPSPGKRPRKEQIFLGDLSDVSETEFEDQKIHVPNKILKRAKPVNLLKRRNHIKEPEKLRKKIKVSKKKNKPKKKKIISKVNHIVKSSDDSDDEYSMKRRKLANAVTLKKNKRDTSTLKDRINSMLFGAKKPSNIIEFKKTETHVTNIRINDKIPNVTIIDNNCSTNVIERKPQDEVQNSDIFKTDNIAVTTIKSDVLPNDNLEKQENVLSEPLKETINLCSDNETSQDVVDSAICEKDVTIKEGVNEIRSEASSDEDLELLRQYALKTKSSKSKSETVNENVPLSTEKNKPSIASDDEDSDTAELRLICLKSTLLKKAIEMKQKQKLRKRLSQSSCLHEDSLLQDEIMNIQSENNTDIESVDMDIGSDGEERVKDNTLKHDSMTNNNINNEHNVIRQEDELEEDEDLLRAKLLTSLSKNLPNLVDINVFNSPKEEIQPDTVKKDNVTSVSVPVPEEKKFIIQLGESDSEGEHEATKNLTKMHMKLAEHYQDFQLKLDNLLKSTRKEFEKETLPDVVQKPALQKPAEKFVPKAMNHLPKSEQIEYKNLVKRMAELEKIKQARNLISTQNKTPVKETLKPRNITMNTLKVANDLEQKIALSRKKIAEESAKVLKLKEEAKKLSQKYKIVATELKNISTAINLNKKQQRAVHSNLQQIRLQHQLLLKGSTHNLKVIHPSNKIIQLNKLQKENNPTAKETSYTNILKTVKVSIVNDVNKDTSSESRLSVQLDVVNNKKTIKLPKNPQTGRVVDILTNVEQKNLPMNMCNKETNNPAPEKGGGVEKLDLQLGHILGETSETNIDDYRSPLTALRSTTWHEDPNGFLCPYEVDGSCRDPECQYLHPKLPSQ